MKKINYEKIKNQGSHSKGKTNSFLKTRAFSIALKKIKASLTIETAIALPIFVFFVIGIMYFLIIISLQMNIQNGMDEAARSIGKKVYLANNIENVYEGLKENQNANESEIPKTEINEEKFIDVDDETKSLVATGLNSLTLKTWILKGKVFEKVAKSKIVGSVAGFRTDKSTYNEKDGILDIVVNYTYKIPFLPSSIANVNFVQRSKTHVWTGREIRLGIDGSESEKRTVYITPTGTVYHSSKTCPYLDLSIRMVSYSQISSLRNKGAAKYYRCPSCAKNATASMVYITDYGTKWHTNLNCSGLKRTIIEKDISEIGDMHECTKCASREPDENVHNTEK